MSDNQNAAPIPDYVAWMFDTGPADDIPDFTDEPAAPRRNLWDLPIFGRFWTADGTDTNS